VKLWPALDLVSADDLLLAALHDFSPTAVEALHNGLRVYFATREHRDRAQAALSEQGIAAVTIEVSDEDWAVRSQQDLAAITVGDITIVPNLMERSEDRSLHESFDRSQRESFDRSLRDSCRGRSLDRPVTPSDRSITIVIEPSMGFGTGHHATTRLCLAALQRTPVAGACVLDVGTGSGILAIAAARLGAAHALGIDFDGDAIQSANENLTRNPDVRTVRFELTDVTHDSGAALPTSLPRADVIVANLTGALLARVAATLIDALNPGGTLIVSGILAAEEQTVRRAFCTVEAVWRQQEDEWIGLMFRSAEA
jgi:ribosomal protein L11 methyltransferase